MTADQLRKTGEGRGLSREQAADQASALIPAPGRVSARAIEIMESTSRFPDVTGVVAALDHVYQPPLFTGFSCQRDVGL
jgi:hypothetical protein